MQLSIENSVLKYSTCTVQNLPFLKHPSVRQQVKSITRRTLCIPLRLYSMLLKCDLIFLSKTFLLEVPDRYNAIVNLMTFDLTALCKGQSKKARPEKLRYDHIALN